VERQVHGVEPSVQQLDFEVTLTSAIQDLDIETDVMPNDDAIAQVPEKLLQCFPLVHSVPRLVSGDTMNGDGRLVVGDLEHRFERVCQIDLAILDADGTDRDHTVVLWIESGGLVIQRDKPDLFRRCLIGPGSIESV